MTNLGDIKISKKLAILVGAGVVQAVCLTALALWSVHTIYTQTGEIEKEARKSELARQIASDINEIQLHVAGSLMTRHFDPTTSERILALRKEYMGDFDELSASTSTAEGKRLRELLVSSVAAWRDTDIKIINLGEAGKFAEAVAGYRQQLEPRIADMRVRMADYLQFRVQQMSNLTAAQADQISRATTLLLVFAVISLVGSLSIGTVLSRGITRPLAVAIAHLGEVAQGDLIRDAPAEFQARGDEIGLLARAKQSMIVNLRQMVQEIAGGVQTLASSSAALSANSGHMSEGGRQASEKAHSVAAAAEQMTANVASVAAGMEQTTTNLASVATATEQMTATIGEIAANSEKARRITGEATQQAISISRQMNQLGQAAHEIGKVTETITEISSQTNLLALNATIEAARAGSAGKGFAVVANEIKALAQQTAAATEDIKGRITGVQSSAAGGIAEIDKVSKVIHEVSDIVSAIAAAIEEQATVTKDIARSIGEASTGVRDANQRVSESSQATQSMTREIEGVDQAVRQMADGSDTVQSSAGELSEVGERLRASVARFRVSTSTVAAPHTASGPAFVVDPGVLQKAVVAHSSWKTHLKAAIATGRLHVSVPTLQADDQCAFGQWLHGAELPAAQKQTAKYRTLRRLHAQFHQEASRVAQLAISGQKQAAEKAMEVSGAFCMVSTELLNALQNCCSAHSGKTGEAGR